MKSDTIRATFWDGKPFNVRVGPATKPTLQTPLDVIVRITTAAICGSDLHTYHGILGSEDVPYQLGHEAMGIVTEVGSGVLDLKVGDRVVVQASPNCGHCRNCERGLNGYCLNLNPPVDIGLFGEGEGFGDHGKDLSGGQSEYMRVPFAEQTCTILPPGTENELDYLFLSDIWPTAWYALDRAGFKPGESVAVFGAGPVGLLCAYTAILLGARRVFSIDHVPSRLALAESIGAIPINFRHEDPVKAIMALEPEGVERSCDCCGEGCVDSDLKPNNAIILEQCIAATAVGGGIGVVGVYFGGAKNKGEPRAKEDQATLESLDFGAVWFKSLTIGTGLVEIKGYQPRMVDLIASGKAKPGFIVSKRIGIEDVPEGYKAFSAHRETKVVIEFPWDRSEVVKDKEGQKNGKSQGKRGAEEAVEASKPKVRRGHGWK